MIKYPLDPNQGSSADQTRMWIERIEQVGHDALCATETRPSSVAERASNLLGIATHYTPYTILTIQPARLVSLVSSRGDGNERARLVGQLISLVVSVGRSGCEEERYT